MPILITLRMGLPLWPFHAPDPHLVRKSRHPVEHRVDLGHYILAVDQDLCSRSRPQRDMQHGAVFADIDLFAGEHRVPPLPDLSRAGEIGEQARVSSVIRFFE